MQNGVTLETNEKDLEVVYGPYKPYFNYDEDVMVLALASLKYILTDLNDIRRKYIQLGFHLYEFKRCNHCYKFGYYSLEDFCAANLGMDKSAVSRCISVWENFAAVDSSHSRKMWIDERYQEYSYSQLCEMVSMDEELRKQVKPDMTIKKIREIKKNNSQNDSSVATSQPEKEKFRFGDYLSKKGIVLYNYIKNLDYENTCGITIFDQDGKEVYSNVAEVLSNSKNGIYVRLRKDDHKVFPECGL